MLSPRSKKPEASSVYISLRRIATYFLQCTNARKRPLSLIPWLGAFFAKTRAEKFRFWAEFPPARFDNAPAKEKLRRGRWILQRKNERRSMPENERIRLESEKTACGPSGWKSHALSTRTMVGFKSRKPFDKTLRAEVVAKRLRGLIRGPRRQTHSIARRSARCHAKARQYRAFCRWRPAPGRAAALPL